MQLTMYISQHDRVMTFFCTSPPGYEFNSIQSKVQRQDTCRCTRGFSGCLCVAVGARGSLYTKCAVSCVCACVCLWVLVGELLHASPEIVPGMVCVGVCCWCVCMFTAGDGVRLGHRCQNMCPCVRAVQTLRLGGWKIHVHRIWVNLKVGQYAHPCVAFVFHEQCVNYGPWWLRGHIHVGALVPISVSSRPSNAWLSALHLHTCSVDSHHSAPYMYVRQLLDWLALRLREPVFADADDISRRHLSCVFGLLVGLVAALVYLSVLVLMRPFVVVNLVTPTWEEVNRYRIDGTLLSCPCTGQSLRINSLLRSPSCTKGSVPPRYANVGLDTIAVMAVMAQSVL